MFFDNRYMDTTPAAILEAELRDLDRNWSAIRSRFGKRALAWALDLELTLKERTAAENAAIDAQWAAETARIDAEAAAEADTDFGRHVMETWQLAA